MSKIDINKLISGDRRTLAKSITLIESKLDSDRIAAQTFLESILPHTGKSIRIGITGIPGVGKSTFIEAFGLHLVEQGKKVAVLAVDPSSPVTGGSIMGDKTRMEQLTQHQDAFIRPSPSSGALGGVAQKTRETMLLCEAAGYEIILVETVGVGQSEIEVASMVDFFLVLMLPNAGDDLQGIKKGIVELADAIVINKADGESLNMAERTRQHYENALHIFVCSSFWSPKVMTCSAIENKKIDVIWNMIQEYQQKSQDNKFFDLKRANQNKGWMQKLVQEMIDIKIKQDPKLQNSWQTMEDHVKKGKTTPYLAAKKLMSQLFTK